MKSVKFFLVVFIMTQYLFSQGKVNFDKYFSDQTMRIDYFHIGNSTSELITLDQIYTYGTWAGSLKNLIDHFNNGKYYIKIYDNSANTLIYSKGFDSYFGEYQTSEDAQKGIQKAYSESAIIPSPKNKIRFVIEKRDDKNMLNQIYSTVIDPNDVQIIKESLNDNSIHVFDDKDNGDPHTRVDIAIIGEGYRSFEKSKFAKDLKNFTHTFLKMEPYKSNKSKFNFHGVFKPSQESGTDEPRANIFKNTILSTTFNSLGSERYLLTEDNKAMRNVAAVVPYDAIVIMVNHSRYGGGGIYNAFCTFTTDNQWSDYLFLHEFGHSFSGLADEYYTSDVSYNNFYKPTVEPVEPNITALLDPSKLKWADVKTPGIQIPTPWEKHKFDSLDYKWQKERRALNDRIAELKRIKSSSSKIKKAEEDYAKKDKEHSQLVDHFLKASKNYGKVGAFEGAGYQSTGLYRPMVDCIMFSKGKKPYCVVCRNAIQRMINYYSE